MKKTKTIIAVAVILIALIGVIKFWTMTKTIYEADGEITAVTAETVIVKTEDGNLWEAYEQGYEIGNAVKVYFNNNHTSIIYDDEIIRMSKASF